jgi:hypothetical protein
MAGAASAFVVSAAQFPTIPVLLLIIEQSLQCTSVHGKDAHFSDLPVRFALVHFPSFSSPHSSTLPGVGHTRAAQDAIEAGLRGDVDLTVAMPAITPDGIARCVGCTAASIQLCAQIPLTTSSFHTTLQTELTHVPPPAP